MLQKQQYERRKQRKSKKKPRRWLDIYVTFSISACIVYTVVALILFERTGTEATQLTTCFFGLFGGEVVVSALIKIFNIKNHEDGGSNNDGTDGCG